MQTLDERVRDVQRDLELLLSVHIDHGQHGEPWLAIVCD